ncbi:hypothetical protein KUCAC02_006236 [Chaenocephalus aceratus]|nr:hypothetical protein KUCAC02_006236 [Chaenocephalus aceratus]
MTSNGSNSNSDTCWIVYPSTATGLSIFGSGTAPALVVDSHGSVSAESEAVACDSWEDGDRTTDACISCELLPSSREYAV